MGHADALSYGNAWSLARSPHRRPQLGRFAPSDRGRLALRACGLRFAPAPAPTRGPSGRPARRSAGCLRPAARSPLCPARCLPTLPRGRAPATHPALRSRGRQTARSPGHRAHAPALPRLQSSTASDGRRTRLQARRDRAPSDRHRPVAVRLRMGKGPATPKATGAGHTALRLGMRRRWRGSEAETARAQRESAPVRGSEATELGPTVRAPRERPSVSVGQRVRIPRRIAVRCAPLPTRSRTQPEACRPMPTRRRGRGQRI